jgi:hypothetical protein
MAPTTQRLKYYDGEFLQSGDFTDEQTYHVDMRRLLNQQLHLHGIVKGLHIVVDANSVPSSPAQFLSVTAGFAIDQIGREIYVTAPVSLTPLLSLAGLQTGTCEIWIVYKETASGTPAPGYQLCNQPSQNTRWTESFALMLRNPSVVPAPGTPNPNYDLKGVCLGLVTLAFDPTTGFYFTRPSNWFSRRSYAKIRAQSIIAPDDVEPDHINFYGPNVLPPDGYIHIKTNNGVFSDGSLLVTNNVLVGSDWTIQNADGSTPTATLPDGNLKLQSDLFVQGTVRTIQDGKWVTLNSLLTGSAPNIQLVRASTTAFLGGPPLYTATATGTATATINFSSVTSNASICGLALCTSVDFNNWSTSGDTSVMPQLSLSSPASTSISSGSSGQSVSVSVTCTQTAPTVATNALIQSVDVLFVVVFQP